MTSKWPWVFITSVFLPLWEGGKFWNVLLISVLPTRAIPTFLPWHSK